ncbi:MAG: thioredoxin domain-containing protein [Acidimicrobiales bacterium]
MGTHRFAVTWDYRCPFPRVAHEHVLAGLEAGADRDVTFLAFSLSQAHVEEGRTPVWQDEGQARGLLAGQIGISVRDRLPDAFPRLHHALFSARHDQARDLNDAACSAGCSANRTSIPPRSSRICPRAVLSSLSSGRALAVERHEVFGVPTFIVGDHAAFVRFMERPSGDPIRSRELVERWLEPISWSELNELKHTTLPR